MFIFSILALAASLLFCAGLCFGSSDIPVDQVWLALTGQETTFAPWSQIIMDLRLPRCITACIAGAGLSLSGLLMQTLFRNPLAGPGVLGVSSGAGLGVAMILLGGGFLNEILGAVTIPAAAFLGAVTVLALVLFLSKRVENAVSLLIIGLMMGYLASAMVSLLTYISPAEQIRDYAIWGMGSFADVPPDRLYLSALGPLLALLLCLPLISSLDILLLGENYAHSMGLRVRRTRTWIILAAALAAGSVTAFCGPIAFLGLAVPHLSRRLLGTSQHGALIPACLMAGMVLALAADLIARLPGSDHSIPLNTVTALIGAPVVIAIVLRRQTWSY